MRNSILLGLIAAHSAARFPMLSADLGAGSGATDPVLPKTLKEATALLAERETALKAAEEKLAGVETAHAEALKALETERDTIRGQFDEAVANADKVGKELAAVRTELEGEKSARTAAEERAVKASENSTRLEKLCQVKGIDATAAVPIGSESPTGVAGSKEDLRRQYASLSDATERARFYAKHKDLLLD
jgi:septal ring factor EnvC (AmiA/AmiB activator)